MDKDDMIAEQIAYEETEFAKLAKKFLDTEVVYIPTHAKNDINHPDCEWGQVSSVNEQFVFVKFYKQLAKFGWLGVTSQSVSPDDLCVMRRF